ncbi:MAG: hypothetical protein AAFR28_14105 [Pseudomonadota bacterium]
MTAPSGGHGPGADAAPRLEALPPRDGFRITIADNGRVKGMAEADRKRAPAA